MTRLIDSLLVLLLLTSSAVAFVPENGRLAGLNAHHPHKELPLQLPLHHPHHPKQSSTALKQATIAPAGYDAVGDKPSFLDRIRARLSGMRGGAARVWTLDENRKLVDNETKKEGSLLERHPFVSAVMITTVNAFAADLITQLVFERNPWKVQRSLLFGAFGFLYQGIAQYAIVNWGWERLFPGTKPKAVIAKICGMNLLSDPLLFMPTFYIFKEFMVQGSLSFSVIKAALLGYKANALMDWRNSWMVWFPGHAVTYGVMPSHKRIPWMAFLSFFYMCVLSLTRGGA